jgi:hypothetical protein
VVGAFEVMMGALEDDSYTAFTSVGDEKVKEAVTKTSFDAVVKQVQPRLKSGYESTYMGALKQQGCDVHLWSLVFKDKGDDMLVQVVWKDSKVVGVLLH